jgi:hypothetical protein
MVKIKKFEILLSKMDVKLPHPQTKKIALSSRLKIKKGKEIRKDSTIVVLKIQTASLIPTYKIIP